MPFQQPLQQLPLKHCPPVEPPPHGEPPTLGWVAQLCFVSSQTPVLHAFVNELQSRGAPVQTPLLQTSLTVQ